MHNGRRTTLYIHIYDETSRVYTRNLREDLQAAADSPLIVAPVQNVSRNAELRQARKPVPWPKPTLLLHDRGDALAQQCAMAIKTYIGAPWVASSDEKPL